MIESLCVDRESDCAGVYFFQTQEPEFISFIHKRIGSICFQNKCCFVGNLFIQQQEKVQYSNKESDIKDSIVCFDEIQMSFQFRCACRGTALHKMHQFSWSLSYVNCSLLKTTVFPASPYSLLPTLNLKG